MWGQKYGTKLVFIHFFYSSMFESSKMQSIRQIETVTESLCQSNKLKRLKRRDWEVLCFHCVTSMFILFSFIFQKPAGQRHILQVGPMWVWRRGFFSPSSLALTSFQKVICTSLSSALFSSFLPFIWLLSLWACCSITWEIFVGFFLLALPRLVVDRAAAKSLPLMSSLKSDRFIQILAVSLFISLTCLLFYLSLWFFFFLTVCVLYTQGIETKQWREVSVCTHALSHTHKEGLCIIQAVLERRAKTLKACSTCFTTSLKLFGNQLSEHARHIFSNWMRQPTPNKEPSRHNDQYVSLGNK